MENEYERPGTHCGDLQETKGTRVAEEKGMLSQGATMEGVGRPGEDGAHLEDVGLWDELPGPGVYPDEDGPRKG